MWGKNYYVSRRVWFNIWWDQGLKLRPQPKPIPSPLLPKHLRRLDYRIAIVGAEESKFTPPMKSYALDLIANILTSHTLSSPYKTVTLISGHCHLGGVDIWAEEMAELLGIQTRIYAPKTFKWSEGYRKRNLQIANDCDEIHNIVVADYHSNYRGMRFPKCYHCCPRDGSVKDQSSESSLIPRHVKSGACWTLNKAIIILRNRERLEGRDWRGEGWKRYLSEHVRWHVVPVL